MAHLESKSENPSPDGRGETSEFFDPTDAIEIHWHNLPHWQQERVFYFCTWRLGDALPFSKLAEWQEDKAAWIAAHPEPWDDATLGEFHERFSRRLDDWLDAGHGSCLLKDPSLAAIVADAMHFLDGSRYDLDGFVVMPNHVHGLFRLLPGVGLPEVIHSLKGFTAKKINKRIGRRGSFWQEDYWDRIIRNEKHLLATRRYIVANAESARGLLWLSAAAKASLSEGD
jgi:type I restriction enzyme R subunit